MEIVKAIVLGIVQGATEFLPVSSSGHLVLGSKILQFQDQGLVFDVFLHLGSLLAVLFVFRHDIKEMVKAPFLLVLGRGGDSEQVRQFLLWDIYICIATLPAVFVGLFLKDYVELLFTNVLVVYLMLIVTGVIMIISRFLHDQDNKLTGRRSFLIGCAQAFAILPGLSRSGSTIFTGMLLGINRETAARFSFIMSIPAIFGAVVLHLREIIAGYGPQISGMNVVAGTVAAAITGYLAIILLLDMVKKNRLQWFGYYCLVIAVGGLLHQLVL